MPYAPKNYRSNRGNNTTYQKNSVFKKKVYKPRGKRVYKPRATTRPRYPTKPRYNNYWKPKGRPFKKKKPVIVWI